MTMTPAMVQAEARFHLFEAGAFVTAAARYWRPATWGVSTYLKLELLSLEFTRK